MTAKCPGDAGGHRVALHRAVARVDAGILIPQGDEAWLCRGLLNPCIFWSVGFKAPTSSPLFSNLSKGVK